VILRTFWVWHKAEDMPDCEAGRAQDTVDANVESWEEEKQKIRDLYGDSIHSEREIEIQVDYNAVLKHWWPDPIEGSVASREEDADA